MGFNFDWNCVSAGAPYVTVSELGFAFNQYAVGLLNNPDNVVLGFDKDNLTIGVMDSKKNPNSKAYLFYGRMQNGWVRIGCKDFVKYLSSITGISFSPAKKYIAQYDQDSEVLFVTVNAGEEDDDSKDD